MTKISIKRVNDYIKVYEIEDYPVFLTEVGYDVYETKIGDNYYYVADRVYSGVNMILICLGIIYNNSVYEDVLTQYIAYDKTIAEVEDKSIDYVLENLEEYVMESLL